MTMISRYNKSVFETKFKHFAVNTVNVTTTFNIEEKKIEFLSI